MAKQDIKTDWDGILTRQVLDINYVLLQEILKVDEAVGTPLYPEKVKILQRTVESHPTIKNDKIYQQDKKDAMVELPDKKILMANRWLPKDKQKKVSSIKTFDFQKLDTAIRDSLARNKLTWKIQKKYKI